VTPLIRLTVRAGPDVPGRGPVRAGGRGHAHGHGPERRERGARRVRRPRTS